MKKQIGTFILKLGGWTDNYPQNLKLDKYVMISAPHTSFWDFVYTIALFWKSEKEVLFLFKDNQVSTLGRCFFKKVGGVSFSKITKDGIDYSVDLINKSDKLILIVPTECSMLKVDKWKTEFYEIANQAKVPVALGYLDYSDRIVGVGHLFNVSGDVNKDMNKIQNFYKNFTPKYPNGYNNKIC